jgi:RNA polymerase sigma factor, sigma-70 family
VTTTTPAPPEARQARAEALAEQIYATHRTRLLAIAKRNSACAEEAEEALQDAFVLFIGHFDPAGGAPALAWITLTLKRRCWTLYRRERRAWAHRSGSDSRRYSDAGLASGWPRPTEDLLELAEEIATMRSHLAKLKPSERRALSLLAAGFSYREICELTAWSYTKVNRCLAEGRARLRELQGANEQTNRR